MKYRTIVVDPPWDVKAGPGVMPYTVDGSGRQVWDRVSRPARDLAFPSMSVGEWAGRDCHLYLWTINRYVEEAFGVSRAWGFDYSTLLVWAKNPMGGGLGGAYGISTEFVLFCRKGKLAATSRMGTTWFNWKRAYDERGKPWHSRKPPAFFEMVERMSPAPRLEVFARGARPGWVVWGDEAAA